MFFTGFCNQKRALLLCAVFAVSSVTGCSFEKMVVQGTADFMQKHRNVFEDESDLELAEKSLASNLKLIEVMAAEDPQNRKINLLLSQLYGAYTLGFVEDQMDEFAESNLEESERHRMRAVDFYTRGRNYAAKALLPIMGYSSIDEINVKNLPERLQKVGKEDIEELFWFAFSWGAALNIQRDNVFALSRMGVIQVMMARVAEVDESYYFAGAVMFEGIYYGERPAFLGGDAARSKKAFERAMKLTQKKFLLTSYYFARTYCIQHQDYEAFQESLQYVIDAPEDILPGQRLVNNIAKRKARRLLERAPEFFIEADD